MCRLVRIAIVALASFISSPAVAEDWWLVVQADEAGLRILADADSIEATRLPDQLRVWTHHFYSIPQGDYHSAAIQYVIDCKNRALREALYRDYGRQRELVRSGDNSGDDVWRLVQPNTSGALVVDFTCGPSTIRSRKFAQIIGAEGKWSLGEAVYLPLEMPSKPSSQARTIGAEMDGYRKCTKANVRKFVRSGETAPVIASAAMKACSTEERQLFASLSSHPEITSPRIQKAAFDRIQKLMREELELDVVRLKSER